MGWDGDGDGMGWDGMGWDGMVWFLLLRLGIRQWALNRKPMIAPLYICVVPVLYGCEQHLSSRSLLADLANGVDTVFISKNDKLYRPPYARDPNTTAYKTYQPYFICSVGLPMLVGLS